MSGEEHYCSSDPVALILNYRTAGRVRDCLASLEREGVKFALVWDNSADHGASAAELRAMGGWRSMEVRIVESPENLGFGAGVNRGLAEIRTWLGPAAVLLVNSDAHAEPGMVAALRLRMLAEGAPAMVAPLRIDPRSRQPGGAMYYHRLTGLMSQRPHRGSFPYLNGCCLLLHPDLTGTPLFDEAFFFYGEDCELSWRLGRAGVALCVEPDARIFHEGSGSSVHASPFYEYQTVRSHLLTAIKTADSRLERCLFLSMRLGILALRAQVRAVRARSAVPLRAYWLALSDQVHDRPAAARQPAQSGPAARPR